MRKKYTLDEIQKRIDEKFEPSLITIAPNQTYTGIRKPLKFIDRDYGEWETTPFNIIQQHNTHPERSKERRKQTNLKKYGYENAAKSPKCIQKGKQTCLERYGAENPMHVTNFKEKLKQNNLNTHGVAYPFVEKEESIEKTKKTNLMRYGAENPSQSLNLRQKQEATNQDRYGFKTPLQNSQIKKKIKSTNNERFGVDYPTQSEVVKSRVLGSFQEKYKCDHPLQTLEVKEKRRLTNLKRYGVNSPRQVNSPRLPNGLLISEYLQLHDSSLWPTSCLYVWKRYGFKQLQNHVENGIPFGRDTALEIAFSSRYGIPIYKKQLPFGNFPDFKLSDTMYLDIDGLYWHSSAVKSDKYYHYEKRIRYEKAGLRLFQFRDDEFQKKPNILQSIINFALSENILSIDARQCLLKKVKWGEGSQFLKENHLQGIGATAYCYGLYYKEELVMLACVRRKARYGSETLEISRICSLQNHRIHGGFSRLLQEIEKQYCPKKLISWCDLRYTTGVGYEAVGFKKEKEVLGWNWTNFTDTYSRRSCRANVHERDLVRIYDAGQRLYVKTY